MVLRGSEIDSEAVKAARKGKNKMEVRATTKYLRVQPRKVRIIADQVRGKKADYIIHLLANHRSKGAHYLRKVLVSAIANAAENYQIGSENLKITTIFVDEGPYLKRIRARAQGRANRILKKTSHITVGVQEVEGINDVVKPHGTKPKPRPTFGTKTRRGGKPAAVKAEVAPQVVPVEEAPAAVTPEAIASDEQGAQ